MNRSLGAPFPKRCRKRGNPSDVQEAFADEEA